MEDGFRTVMEGLSERRSENLPMAEARDHLPSSHSVMPCWPESLRLRWCSSIRRPMFALTVTHQFWPQPLLHRHNSLYRSDQRVNRISNDLRPSEPIVSLLSR